MNKLRKCAERPRWTQTVCRHAFGKFWDVKSRNGEGCDFHLDDVAEAWRNFIYWVSAATLTATVTF